MRKGLIALLLCVLMLGGCAVPKKNSPSSPSGETHAPSETFVGVWISYVELDEMLRQDFKKNYQTVLKNCREFGMTDLFVHVRPFCDAVYPSEIFPLRSNAGKYDYDVLEYMVTETHRAGLRFHAWLNPYRVRTADADVTKLDAGSPAAQWLKKDENCTDICLCNGIYLNPASEKARRLILDGVREILNNYDVDGIHIDDYFYPTDAEKFDAASYKNYCGTCASPLSRDDWRRANVDALISGIYTAVKFCDRSLIFSVSPAASVEKNRSSYYADVTAWMKNGCVDWIIPQLYFGMEYPDPAFRFDRLLSEWAAVPRAETVRLIIGLAAYKINTKQSPDTAEWENNAELLPREAALCREEKSAAGYVFYSYTSLFASDPVHDRMRKLYREEQNVKNN